MESQLKCYAGIGSRKTPSDICEMMTHIARFLCVIGYVLRSGAAGGADSAFESGVSDESKKQIFLPWKSFNGNPSNLFGVGPKAYVIGKDFHPKWAGLSESAQLLIARNSYQILGRDLKSPCSFVICWTPNGKDVGGTAQALRIARHYEIPIYNLFLKKDRSEISKWIAANKVLICPERIVESWNLM